MRDPFIGQAGVAGDVLLGDATRGEPFKTGLVFACAVFPLHAAPIISEASDKPRAVEKWKADAAATVKDGAWLLTATGAAEVYANAGGVMKAGDPALDFTAKPVEIEVRELDITGPGFWVTV